jgi:hypothetical protein
MALDGAYDPWRFRDRLWRQRKGGSMTKAEKEAFKKRMAAGRKKAAKARGEQSPKKKKPAARNAKKNATVKKNKRRNPLTGVPSKDIPRLLREGKSQKQAEAIALSEQRRLRAGGRKRRRNQEPGSIESAEAGFQSFHGKPPGKILEYDEEVHYPEHYFELGKLVELRFFLNEANPDFALTRFGACQVVATPDGANIEFFGGDQSIDLAALDISTDKNLVELGPCTYISYHTVKGFHDFEPTTYWHQFGEEDGIFPGLVYDRLNKRLHLTSGNYRVRPEGIVN